MGEARRKKLAQAAGAAAVVEQLREVQVKVAMDRYGLRRTEYQTEANGRKIFIYRSGPFLFVRTEDVAPQEVTPTDYVRLFTRPDGGPPITVHEVRAAARAARRGAA